MLAAAELYPEIPIAMHQDHGNSPATCKSAIENGFTSVMMDGSLKEDGKTMCGSLVVVEVDTLDAAKAVAGADPFAKAGLFATVEIRPWLWVLGKPEGK